MAAFSEIIGHEEIVEHIKNTIKSDKVSHSYIFNGIHGAGKKLLAFTFAMALQCTQKGQEPCQKCESCKKAIGKNHPDIITVTHEKPGSISIDEVRAQLVNDITIKPYEGRYKIYIIPDADLMTQQAQNAILKTIEEPPYYAVIMLLTDNINALLPTIISRCVRLDLKIVSDEQIKKYLMEHMHITDYQAEIDAAYAQGSIGKAKETAVSEEFYSLTERALKILKSVDVMKAYQLAEEIRFISAEKSNINDYLDIFQFWFRDVLLFKATKEIDHLIFKQEINYIREQANERTYENIENILEALEKIKIRLKANVNPEIAFELLFLSMRDKK